MAVRATMSDLIERTRELIGDPAGADQAFSPASIQNALDRHQAWARYEALRAEPDLSGQYLEHFAAVGDWEADERLYDSSGTQLTPATADRVTGYWTFAASTPSVYLVGKTYDLYGAAADLLEQWAARLARKFDISDSNSSYKRSQAAERLESLARTYRQQQRVRVISMSRSDAN